MKAGNLEWSVVVNVSGKAVDNAAPLFGSTSTLALIFETYLTTAYIWTFARSRSLPNPRLPKASLSTS